MLAFEVLQTFPSQRNALLFALGALEPSVSKVINFDITYVKPCLPYHVAFQIHVDYLKYTIKCVVVDEGTTTCVMSLVCWKALGSLNLSKSSNMLISFDGHSFHPHGILLAFPVKLGGKMVEVKVEVVDAPLDYKPLLGCNWTYAMIIIVSSIFRTLCFLHEGNIVTIDQLSFACFIPNASIGPSILVIENSQSAIKNIGVKMYSSLMGTFNFAALIHHVYAMSIRPVLIERSILFRTSYFNAPWTLTSPSLSCEVQSHVGMAMPLSATDIAYQFVLDSFVDPDPVPSLMNEEDIMSRPVWATSLSCSHDFLDGTFPSDKAGEVRVHGALK